MPGYGRPSSGGLLGGLWMLKIGINRALWLFGVVQLVSIFGFAWLAWLGPQTEIGAAQLTALALVIGFEALGVGLGSAAFVAYIAKNTHPLYTATQFALFTSLAAVPRTVVNATTGWLVELLGWLDFLPALRPVRRAGHAAAAQGGTVGWQKSPNPPDSDTSAGLSGRPRLRFRALSR